MPRDGRVGRALALGRLLRLSLAPSALADSAAGCVLAASAWPGGAAPFVLMLGSACVYHGGMALNDWADRAEDARVRPGRPIPSGALGAGAALALAALLLVAGPLLGSVVAPRSGMLLGAVALAAAFYDLAGRGPWLGPLLLAVCRAGNLGAGLALGAAHGPPRAFLWLAPLVYGAYVFCVSRLARLEDLAPERYASGTLRPGRWVVAAGAALLGIGVVGAVLAFTARQPVPDWYRLLRAPFLVPLFLASFGAFGLFALARELADHPWGPRDVQRAAGMALRRLLIGSASLSAGAGTPAGLCVAALILLGYPLSFALRKVFPPT